MLRHRRRVVPRRIGGSSPTSKTGSAPTTCLPPLATCAPEHPADPGRCSHHVHRIRLPRKRFGGRIHRRTPNTFATKTFRRHREGHKTTPPRAAASGGVPAPVVTPPVV